MYLSSDGSTSELDINRIHARIGLDFEETLWVGLDWVRRVHRDAPPTTLVGWSEPRE